jgi:CRP-like cAMP-binding protein
MSPPLRSSSAPAGQLLPEETATLQRNRWFGHLAEAVRNQVLAQARVQRLPAGHVLARRGDPATAWYGVAAGALSLCSVLPDGRSFRLNVIGPGRWWGDIAVIDGKPQDLDIQTQMPTTLLVLSRTQLLDLMQARPDLRDALLQLQCERLRHLFRRTEELQSLPLHQSVARMLCRLGREFGLPASQGLCIDLNLTQSDLAALIGASRQRVNASLRQLHKQQVIELQNTRLWIRDEAALREIAGA